MAGRQVRLEKVAGVKLSASGCWTPREVKRGTEPQETEEHSKGLAIIPGGVFLPHSDGSITTAVGVVDNGIEGLIDPLPEYHSWRLPGRTKTFTSTLLHYPSSCSLQ